MAADAKQTSRLYTVAVITADSEVRAPLTNTDLKEQRNGCNLQVPALLRIEFPNIGAKRSFFM